MNLSVFEEYGKVTVVSLARLSLNTQIRKELLKNKPNPNKIKRIWRVLRPARKLEPILVNS
jgi:hypothetical protein